MRQVRGRRRVILGLLAAVFLGITAYAVTHAFTIRYVLETRRFLLAMKTGGHAPDVGWLPLARRMGPRWMQRDSPTFVAAVGEGPEPCPVQWRTPLGDFWGGRDDGRILDHLMMEQLGGRIYDRGAAALRPGDTVIDVGGHLGTFTRYALRAGASRVVAVEPVPQLVSCLQRTFAPEIASGAVVIAPVAAWNVNTTLEFLTGPQSTMCSVGDQRDASTIRVIAETLDTMVARLGLSRVDFIKMDIEGAEPEALAGAAGLIARDHPRMAICIYHHPDHARMLPAAVLGMNAAYRIFYRRPFQAYFHQ